MGIVENPAQPFPFIPYGQSNYTFPYDAISLITGLFPTSSTQGSGIIIGPHTILTAAHVVWSADAQRFATSISVSPGYIPNSGSRFIPSFQTFGYEINDRGDMIDILGTQADLAVINATEDLTKYGHFGVLTDFGGGSVDVSGYAAAFNGSQGTLVRTVTTNPSASGVFDYTAFNISGLEGISGGPLWVDLGSSGNPEPYVVGLVSTGSHAVELTSADWATISSWVAQDSYAYPGWGLSGAKDLFGDFNHDGRADILELDPNGKTNVSLSSGASFLPNTTWGSGNRTSDKIGDFNGDGKADVIQLHENGNSYVWLSTGSSFSNYTVWGHGHRPTDKIADVNGDGKADIIQLHENGNAYVWISNGSSFNNYTVWGHGNRPTDQLADFNGDGKADIIQLHENGNAYVWLSNGNGFDNYSVWGHGVRPSDKLGDFNGDGKSDIVELNENGNSYVWVSNGSGFNNYTVWGHGNLPTDQIADVNGDGKDDIIQLYKNGNAYVWLSNGNGFSNYSVWGTGFDPSDMIVDVNGDHRADIVRLSPGGDAFVWLSNGNGFNSPVVWGQGPTGLQSGVVQGLPGMSNITPLTTASSIDLAPGLSVHGGPDLQVSSSILADLGSRGEPNSQEMNFQLGEALNRPIEHSDWLLV